MVMAAITICINRHQAASWAAHIQSPVSHKGAGFFLRPAAVGTLPGLTPLPGTMVPASTWGAQMLFFCRSPGTGLDHQALRQ